jgi:hypothetical protein
MSLSFTLSYSFSRSLSYTMYMSTYVVYSFYFCLSIYLSLSVYLSLSLCLSLCLCLSLSLLPFLLPLTPLFLLFLGFITLPVLFLFFLSHFFSLLPIFTKPLSLSLFHTQTHSFYFNQVLYFASLSHPLSLSLWSSLSPCRFNLPFSHTKKKMFSAKSFTANCITICKHQCHNYFLCILIFWVVS